MYLRFLYPGLTTWSAVYHDIEKTGELNLLSQVHVLRDRPSSLTGLSHGRSLRTSCGRTSRTGLWSLVGEPHYIRIDLGLQPCQIDNTNGSYKLLAGLTNFILVQ